MTIRNIVKKKKISFLGLVETKHRRSIRSRMKRMWGNDDFDICEVFANDTYGGGVIAAWDINNFSVSVKHVGCRWILLEGLIKSHDFQCCIGVVYGHKDRAERQTLLEEVREKVVTIDKLILLLEDFNVVLNAGERIGSFRCDRSMREFSEWIEQLGLIDIPLQGVKFTWRRNESKSRLDRGLCCQTWLRRFPNLSMVGLHRSFSDHNPLLLSLQMETNWGPKPFRCYDAWFLNPKFKQFLIEEWRKCPSLSLQHKLKFLKARLKEWKRDNFDSMDNKIHNLEAVVHGLERTSDIRALDNMEVARLNAASNTLHQWLIRRERIWRQSARTYGLK